MVFMYEEADIPVLANLLQKKEAIPLGLQEGRQLKKSLCKGDINGEGVFIEWNSECAIILSLILPWRDLLSSAQDTTRSTPWM